MQKKNQHVIPECYLKAWCDPGTPLGQEPYVWRVSRDGTEMKNKAPRKIFVSSHFYTISLPDGTRELGVEDNLQKLEDRFCRLRDQKISKQSPARIRRAGVSRYILRDAFCTR